MSKKLYSFSDHPEHEAHLKAYNDKWIASAISTQPMDESERDICRNAVVKMYEAAKLPAPKHIVFVPSPFVLRFAGGFAAAIWHMRKSGFKPVQATDQATYQATQQATDQATHQATQQATAQATRQATDQATDQATRQATAQATQQATYQATRQATHQATYQATRQATAQATDQATDQATYQATRQATGHSKWYRFDVVALRKLSFSLGLAEFGLKCAQSAYSYMWQSGNQWSGWASYLGFFKDVAKLGLSVHTPYESTWETLAKHSGPRIMHPDFCMISDRPCVLKQNARNQPHCEDGPFCEWSDGSALYALNGVFVPQWVVETKPEDFTREMITKETNADVRREIVRRVGNRRLLELLSANVISKNTEGDELITFDIGDGRVRPFAKLVCPSTGLTHVLGVEPKVSTIEGALAYLFKQDAYRRPMKEDKEVRQGSFADFSVGQTIGRHGDVNLKKTANPIRTDQPLFTGILHAGNNHNHTGTGAYYVRTEGEERFIGILDSLTLDHEEHGPQKWGAHETGGTELKIEIAQEYDHWLEESRQMID